MKRKHVLIALCLTGLMACQADTEPVEKAVPTPTPKEEPTPQEPEDIPFIARLDIDLEEQEKRVAQQNLRFAFDLLQTIHADEDTQKNIFVSPLSLNLALLMLNNGAAGETQKELERLLGYEGVQREVLNSYAQKMVKAMQELDPRALFESANSIWIRNTFPVLESFKDVNRQYFEAEVRNEDFTLPATLDLINGWVEEKTHGKIPTILNGISPDVMLYLINTLYFKGHWRFPFDKEATVNRPFFNQDGRTPNIPTMHTAQRLGAVQNEQFTMLELPFGNGAFSLVIILPDKGVSVDDIAASLDADAWTGYLEELQGAKTFEADLLLPTFKVEYERELNDDLMAMGLVSAFGMANLTLIHPTAPLRVSNVLQKTFVEVNELGMEAAAATLIAIVMSMPPPAPKLDFHVDRPFLLFIKEQSTGIPFFSGIIRNLE